MVAKRHHTVPRMHLKGFTDPKGRLRAFDRVRQRQQTITVGDATVVRGFYSLPSASDLSEGLAVDSIEKLLAEKEGAVAVIFDRLRAGRGLSPEDIPALADYIAIQLLRTTRFETEIQAMADYYARTMLEGMSEDAVRRRLLEVGEETDDDAVASIMESLSRLDEFSFRAPEGSFMIVFLRTYLKLTPYVANGWKWIVASTSKPFLVTDHPVVLVGDSVDSGVGLETAAEVWMPIGRHHALVMSRDFSLPTVLLNLERSVVRQRNLRLALESQRWCFWNPRDDPLEGAAVPPPANPLRERSLGWRERPDGTFGEVVQIGAPRPLIPGESLLSGIRVVNRTAVFGGLRPMDSAPWTRSGRK